MLAALRHRDFGLLWAAGLVSVAGDFALLAAPPLHAYALTGSAAATAGVFAAALLPRVLLGSVAGVLADRWDRKRTMVAADLLRAALLLPLLAVRSPDLLWVLLAVRAAVGTVGLVFEPAESALLPRLVGEGRLATANALNALNNNLGRLAGPAAGGALYAWGGLEVVVVADAASFVAAAALVAAVRADARPLGTAAAETAASAWARMLGEWRAGLGLIRRTPATRAVFAASAIGNVGEGTFSLGFVPLAVDVLGGGPEGVGLLLSAQAVGGIAAGALVARAAGRAAPRVLFGAGMVGMGLSHLGVANATALAPPGSAALAVAAAVMALAGFPVVATVAAGDGLLQATTADAYRGRVFGAIGAARSVAVLVGLGVGGVAADAIGVVPVVTAGGGMWVAGGLVALARLPRGAGLPATTDATTAGG